MNALTIYLFSAILIAHTFYCSETHSFASASMCKMLSTALNNIWNSLSQSLAIDSASILNVNEDCPFTTNEIIKVLKDKGRFYFSQGNGYENRNISFLILEKIISSFYSIKTNTNKAFAAYLAA